jgi:hypothetical protein
MERNGVTAEVPGVRLGAGNPDAMGAACSKEREPIIAAKREGASCQAGPAGRSGAQGERTIARSSDRAARIADPGHFQALARQLTS